MYLYYKLLKQKLIQQQQLHGTSKSMQGTICMMNTYLALFNSVHHMMSAGIWSSTPITLTDKYYAKWIYGLISNEQDRGNYGIEKLPEMPRRNLESSHPFLCNTGLFD